MEPIYEAYDLKCRKPVFAILRFSPDLAVLEKPEKRARARLYCPVCQRHHHLAWGEMQNAIKRYGAASLDDIVRAYSWKYCHVLGAREGMAPEARLKKERALSEHLETLHPDVDVIECAQAGGNLFSMKIQTPMGTYLDTATAEEWKNLVQEDIRKSREPVRCPFCGGTDITNASDGLRCRSCHAKGFSIDTSLPSVSEEMDKRQMTPGKSLAVLRCFDEIFRWDRSPHGMDILWVDADRLEKLEPERDFDEIARNARGVWKTQSPVVAEIPSVCAGDSGIYAGEG